MIINKLAINNFLAIGNAEINLNNRGLVSITGIYKNNNSADSNGTGKSSIVDAICWCLFGTTSKGVSADEVVNDVVKKDCSVSLEILDGDKIYNITRFRKHTQYKSSVQVVIDGKDASCPTVAENDALIESLIGMNEKIFKYTVYCGQEEMPKYPALTDKQIKELIEVAAGLDSLQAAYEIVKQRKASNEVQYKANLMKLDGLKNQLKSLKEQQESLETDAVVWKARHVSELEAKKKRLDNDIADFKRRVAEYGNKYSKDVGKELADKKTQLDQISVLEDEYRRKQIEATNAGLDLSSIQGLIKNHKLTIEANKQEIEEIVNGIKGVCPTCGRRFDEETINKAIDKIKTINSQVEQEIISNGIKLRLAKERYEEALKAEEEAKKAIPNYKELTDQIAVLSQTKATQEAEYNGLMRDKQNIVKDKEELEKQELMENPISKSIDNNKKQIKLVAEQIKQTESDCGEDLKQATIDNDLMTTFGPAGVRAHLLDVVTPFLNARTQRYLHTLSHGLIEAEWSTLSINKSGELKEKFQINVINKEGAKNYKGLSGGEKRKVNLACALALQDLVASRADKSFDLWIGDEITDALDETGLEMLMSVLTEKTKEKGTVLVISHSDLKDWIDQNITVIKENRISRVEEK